MLKLQQPRHKSYVCMHKCTHKISSSSTTVAPFTLLWAWQTASLQCIAHLSNHRVLRWGLTLLPGSPGPGSPWSPVMGWGTAQDKLEGVKERPHPIIWGNSHKWPGLAKLKAVKQILPQATAQDTGALSEDFTLTPCLLRRTERM